MPQTPEGLRNIVAGILDIPTDQVAPELAVGTVEAWDSFGHLQLILALEMEYGVQFDPQKIPLLTTIALLESELRARGAAL